MKPAPFHYFAPATLEQAVELLGEHGSEAMPLAGGQSLVPAMNFRMARPSVLIDLNRIEALTGIREDNGSLRIGAMTRQRSAERSEVVRRMAPLLSETIPWIAHAQIRNRGTIGGSLAHADPSSELPAVMVALGARILLRGVRGERRVPAAEFYKGLFTTARAEDELLLAVEVPGPVAGSGSAFEEVARRHGDYALVGVAATLTLGGDGRCDGAAVVLISVGGGPVRARAAARLEGEQITPELIRAVAEEVATRDIDPPSDVHASAEYRRQLARVLVGRALARSAARATESGGDGW